MAMSPFKGVLAGFVNWQQFGGRANRTEFWSFLVFAALLWIVAGIVCQGHFTISVVLSILRNMPYNHGPSGTGFMALLSSGLMVTLLPLFLGHIVHIQSSLTQNQTWFLAVLAIGTLVPLPALIVRRFHDVNMNSWWTAIIFLGPVGWLVPLLYGLKAGSDGVNRYGLPRDSETLKNRARRENLVYFAIRILCDFGCSVWNGWARTFDFAGRSGRREFWYWLLFCLFALNFALFLEKSGNGKAYAICLVALYLPTVAVTVRRFHDVNMTGLWGLSIFIPFGVLVYLVFCSKVGTRGKNRFDSVLPRDPKLTRQKPAAQKMSISFASPAKTSSKALAPRLMVNSHGNA